jgi:hypothetical protein
MPILCPPLPLPLWALLLWPLDSRSVESARTRVTTAICVRPLLLLLVVERSRGGSAEEEEEDDAA